MTQPDHEQNQESSSFSGKTVGPVGEITHDPLPVIPPRADQLPDKSEITDETPAIISDEDDGQNDIIGQDDDEAGKVMTVIEHLDELRTRILRGLAAFGVTMIISLFFGKDVIVWLEQPAGAMRFQALSLEEPMIVYFKVAFYVAIVLASPFILAEMAGFVWPGLKKKEKQVLLPIIVGGPLLFVAGALFAYYLALPPMLYFFNSFGQAMTPINQRLDFYISLVLTIMMYMGLCFQLPILIFCLSFAGIVNSRQLMGLWRYAIMVSAVVAAIVTPDPTVISMLIVMVALVSLYFGSVLLLKVFGK